MTPQSGIARGLRGLFGLALNALLPPRCLGCGTVVARTAALCAGCWKGVQYLEPPLCALCGFPLEYDLGPEALCGACAREPPRFDRARAVMRYDEGSRGLVLGFKHADRTEGAAAYGAWLARAGAELTAEADLIVPVPLHWMRLFTRRFNQAALLAQAVGPRNRPAGGARFAIAAAPHAVPGTPQRGSAAPQRGRGLRGQGRARRCSRAAGCCWLTTC